MFKAALAFTQAASEKFDMGVRLRQAYKAGNKVQMREICKQMSAAIQRVDEFLQAYRKQWLTLYKPLG